MSLSATPDLMAETAQNLIVSTMTSPFWHAKLAGEVHGDWMEMYRRARTADPRTDGGDTRSLNRMNDSVLEILASDKDVRSL